MNGISDILRQGFEKDAEIPEGKPKWGTTPEADLPGEQHPEGVDENHPVGDDEQNTRHLQTNFSSAGAVEAELRQTLSHNFVHFTDPSRVSATQLIKDFPKTNARAMQSMTERLRARLLG